MPGAFICQQIAIILKLEANAISAMPHLAQGCSKVEVVIVVDEIVSYEFDPELEVDGEVLEVGTKLVFEDLLRHGSKLLL